MTTVFGDTAQTFWQRVALMTSLQKVQMLTPAAWYDMLEEYYFNNSLYDDVSQILRENAIWTPGMKSLRNPAHRAVEFHVAKLWGGPLKTALPILTGDNNEKLEKAIRTIWEWSNFGAQKQILARWYASQGDMFIKVAQKIENGKVTRVFLDPIKPKHVTDLNEDERGYVTYMRIDVPTEEVTHTEVWSKTRGDVRIWQHNKSVTSSLDQLGEPNESKDFAVLQYDFIPIVHSKFIDVGDVRGVGCFVHALDKIDEANRQATRLHQMLFRYNKPTQAISANGNDSSGKPLPPPTILGRDGSSSSDSDSVSMGDDDLMALPGMAKLEQLVPQLQYADALSILNAQMEEISRDLPEVLYHELKDKDLSGVAIQRLLGPAIDRVIDARGNAEPALVRANQMALTIAGIHKLNGFTDIGTYENGDFEHSFAERDVIQLTKRERAEVVKTYTDANMPLDFAMKQNGYSDDEINQVMKSPEYKIYMEKILWEAIGAATTAMPSLPVETFLARVGWDTEKLKEFGTQRLAAIRLQQEDTIPPVDWNGNATNQQATQSAPSNLETTKGLNGAQINAAKDLLTAVSLGNTAPEVAIELLISLGLDQARARRMVDAAKQTTITNPTGQ